MAALIGACSRPSPELASCEEVATGTAALLIDAIDAGGARQLAEDPPPGEALIGRLASAVEDAQVRGRAAALRDAETELACGGPSWADEEVAALLAEESAKRLEAIADEDREPTADEHDALNALAIVQAALTRRVLRGEIDLFE